MDLVTIEPYKDGYRLECAMVLERPIDEVFLFFSEAQNLEEITPPFLRFKIASALPIEMKLGTKITYSLSLHGLPLRWVSVIDRWDPPFAFCDRQMKGPYRYWIHHHEFESFGRWTVVRDRVLYSSIGGALVNSLFVAPDLKKIFSYRQETLRRLLAPS